VPAQKKDPSVRQRRNKAPSAATLTKQTKPKVPALPSHPTGYPWHPQAVAFWRDVWSSPMSPEWDPSSDQHNVLMCALLVHDIWSTESAAARAKAASEFRLQRASLGLSPYDRRRLEWTIEQADEAVEKGAQRRAAKKAPARRGAKKAADPRAHLSAVPDAEVS
jgi:hypothetical protein